MSQTLRCFVSLTIVVFVFSNLNCADSISTDVVPPSRDAKFLRFPWLGHFCNGCPPHVCEADPAIVLGYCCGCRRIFDVLPIVCSANVICPMEVSGVCRDYDYMLRCCC
ncbi:uncharacterized protein LOC107275082 [Cephus cinctus]|uniref:Uncharacterized protein LOC107275082 n=1 Tax=Cephus cinctus TaxID=211228 RepID=A0AAJ7FVI7_CEPCN|nr:uncharacterized protein LOC107275082 [Cephus cinctus]